MIPKSERFSAKDFSNKNLFKNNQKIYTLYGFFVVLDGDLNKKAIVISKKNFKTAILRNKYKRLFYAVLSKTQKNYPILKQKTFIFNPKKIFTKDELEKDLINLFVL